jgi:hypothetical protein
MHFLFNLLRIKGLYILQALLALPQEAPHKRHLVYCVLVMSLGCTNLLLFTFIYGFGEIHCKRFVERALKSRKAAHGRLPPPPPGRYDREWNYMYTCAVRPSGIQEVKDASRRQQLPVFSAIGRFRTLSSSEISWCGVGHLVAS